MKKRKLKWYIKRFDWFILKKLAKLIYWIMEKSNTLYFEIYIRCIDEGIAIGEIESL